MKVSQTQKAKIQQALLEAATALFVEKGFQSTTMREISTRAGYSAGTIYSYFPSKDRIFFAYFDEKQGALFDTIRDIDAFDSFTIKEKLQTVLEVQLEHYLADREFVGCAFKALMDSPLRSFSELKKTKDRFAAEVERYFEAAVAAKEVPPQPFDRFFSHLFWDYRNLIVLYWLRDDSVGFANTSRLIDMSLDVFVAAIQSDIVTKTWDVVLFLFKSHLFGNIDRLFDLVGAVGWMRRDEG